MKRNKAIEKIKAERGEISGQNLKALIQDVYDAEAIGSRFLRTDKLAGDRWALQNLTTYALRAIAKWLEGERVKV